MYQQFSPTFGSGRTYERTHEQRLAVLVAACGGGGGAAEGGSGAEVEAGDGDNLMVVGIAAAGVSGRRCDLWKTNR